MRKLDVTAAIIENDRGEILICRRQQDTDLAGYWEFPGGKTEKGESEEECIVRECREELGIEIGIKSIYAKTNYLYPDKWIDFTFYKAYIIKGEAKCYIHQEMTWVKRNELSKYCFCPADKEIIEKLESE